MPSPTNPPSKALVASRIRNWIEAFLEDPRRKRISAINRHLNQYRDSYEEHYVKEAARAEEIIKGNSGSIDDRDMPNGAMTTKVYFQVAETVNAHDLEGDSISIPGIYEDLVEQFPELNRRSVQNFTSKVFRSIVDHFPEEFKIDITPWALEGKRGRGRLPRSLFRLTDKKRDLTPQQIKTMTNSKETDARRDDRRSK